MKDQELLSILNIIVRIIGVAVCASQAKTKNRNEVGWGVFGFCMPIIAMIIISFKKPKIKWHQEKNQTNNI
jgi:hypothetical protein